MLKEEEQEPEAIGKSKGLPVAQTAPQQVTEGRTASEFKENLQLNQMNPFRADNLLCDLPHYPLWEV